MQTSHQRDLDGINTVINARFAEYQARLVRDGYLYVDLPEGADHVAFAQRFGALMPQYDGKEIWSIKADPKFDNHYHSLNTKKLNPHTECYEYAGTPPRYLALWCIETASCGGGQTTLADAYAFVAGLPENEREYVRSKKFRYVSSSGIQASGLGKVAEHHMYDEHSEERPIVRFSFNCMDREGDPLMEDIATRCVKFFDDTHVSIHWRKNAFLIWDNYRMMHSRTSYEDRTRELGRVWLR